RQAQPWYPWARGLGSPAPPSSVGFSFSAPSRARRLPAHYPLDDVGRNRCFSLFYRSLEAGPRRAEDSGPLDIRPDVDNSITVTAGRRTRRDTPAVAHDQVRGSQAGRKREVHRE